MLNFKLIAFNSKPLIHSGLSVSNNTSKNSDPKGPNTDTSLSKLSTHCLIGVFSGINAGIAAQLFDTSIMQGALQKTDMTKILKTRCYDALRSPYRYFLRNSANRSALFAEMIVYGICTYPVLNIANIFVENDLTKLFITAGSNGTACTGKDTLLAKLYKAQTPSSKRTKISIYDIYKNGIFKNPRMRQLIVPKSLYIGRDLGTAYTAFIAVKPFSKWMMNTFGITKNHPNYSKIKKTDRSSRSTSVTNSVSNIQYLSSSRRNL